MRELTQDEKRQVAELAFDTAKAVSHTLHSLAEQFLPRVRAVHLLGCSQPTHPEESILRDAEMNVLVATGVVFTMLLQGLPPEAAAQTTRAISSILGAEGSMEYQRLAPPTPKVRA